MSHHLFTSLNVIWLQNVKDKALLNPYAPYKCVVRTNARPLKVEGCVRIEEWLHFGSHIRRLELRQYSVMQEYVNLKTIVVTQITGATRLHTLTSISLFNSTIDVDELSRILANKPAITKLVLHTIKELFPHSHICQDLCHRSSAQSSIKLSSCRESLEEMDFKKLEYMRFLMGFNQVMSLKDVESGKCTMAARSLIIERILARQRDIISMESFHKGIVNYTLPVLMIQKIIRMLWRTLWMDYNHRATAYASLLELCLVSKEMFHFVSHHLFTSLNVNWIQNVSDGVATPYYKAFFNPYSPYKRVTRTNVRPLKVGGCPSIIEWLRLGSSIRRLEIRQYTSMQEYIELFCPLDHLTCHMEENADYMRLAKLTNLKTLVVTQMTKSCAPSFLKFLHTQVNLTSLSLINVTIDVDELSRILANKPAIIKLVLHSQKTPVIPATLQTLFVNPSNDYSIINNYNNDDDLNNFMVTYLRITKEIGKWNRDLSYLSKLTSVRKFRLSTSINKEDTDHLFRQILELPNVQRIIFDLDNSDYKPPRVITPQSIEEWSNCAAHGLSIIRVTPTRSDSLKVTFVRTKTTTIYINR
eukprot:gene11422-13314_t